MEEGIYYKRGSKSDFAGVEILGDDGVIERAVIEKIAFHDRLKVQGKPEQERWTCKFQGIEKPVLLNSTNRKRIAKRFWDTEVADGTPCHGRINLLSGLGLAVRLDSEPCRDPSDGTMTVGLRVSLLDPAPAGAAKATSQKSEKKVIPAGKVQDMISWAKGKGKSFEDIAAQFDFESDEVRDAMRIGLTDDLPE